jgi:hypothetical protein
VAKEKSFSPTMKCGHCQNKAPMEVVVEHSQVQEHEDDGGCPWEAGYVYGLLQCPACEGITLRRYTWNDSMDPEDVRFEFLYPVPEKQLRGLPKRIDDAYKAAQKVRNIDANAYGVLLGRVLDLICQDRSATGATLDEQLKNLADRGEIPGKLVDVAKGLRKMRNVGAHAALGELTIAELPVLDDLTRAILDYVYSASLLATEAENRLAELKRRKPSPKKSPSK